MRQNLKKMTNSDILGYWNNLWTKDDYYANHDILAVDDGISKLLNRALEGAKSGQAIAEIGSGPGTRSIPLAKEKSLKLTLFDVLESAHKLAEMRAKRYGIDCAYVLSDARSIKCGDNSFDYVFSNGVNEHFFGNDRSKVFEEMYRLTKPNGRTIVIVPNKLGVSSLEQLGQTILGRWVFGPTDFFTPGELKKYMEQLGFKKIEMYGVSVLTSVVRLFPTKLRRKIFQSKNLWHCWAHLPGNFSLQSFLNLNFGEEIMAVGYK